MADVNGDGFPDIYVCAVVGINGFEGQNELFINSKTFTEVQPNMVLDLDNYSSRQHFFDYDLDGDLDMYFSIMPFTQKPLLECR
jgi:hypothetical protein